MISYITATAELVWNMKKSCLNHIDKCMR